MKIKDLRLDQCGTVTGYAPCPRPYRQKLLQMGLITGARFRLIRKAPLGDPVEIEVKGFNLTLRKSEAEVLEIEPVEKE